MLRSRRRRRAILAPAAATAFAGFGAACGGSQVGALERTAASPSAAPTPTARLQPPLTYVAIGASDTAGVGVEDPQHEAWVNVLAEALPQPVRVVNLGIAGATVRRALADELPDALAVLGGKPGLATVWLAVNDLLEGVPLDEYRSDLDQLVATLRGTGEAQVAVGNVPNPPPASGYLQVPGQRPEGRRAIIAAWNAAIAEVATARGAILADVFRQWPVAERPDFIGPDRFHPSAAGYAALAAVFRQALAAARVI